VRRRLFTLAPVLSMLLCLATVALWVRSYFASYRLAYNTVHVQSVLCVEYRIRIGHGLVLLQRARRQFSTSEAVEMFEHDLPLTDHEKVPGFSYVTLDPEWYEIDGNTLFASLGFWNQSFHDSKRIARVRPTFKEVGTLGITGENIFLPLWFVALLFAVLPASRITTILQQRHTDREHLCPTCGYNLTGNTSGVCPECGTPATHEQRTTSN